MSETANGYPSLKRRWIGAGLGFLIGGVGHGYLLWESLAFIGAGHGHIRFGNLFDGPCELSLFLFPFVCAAAASRWIPAVVAALLWECVHHVATWHSLLRIPDVFDAMRSHYPDSISALWLVYGLYFAIHLLALTVIIHEIRHWLIRDREARLHPQAHVKRQLQHSDS